MASSLVYVETTNTMSQIILNVLIEQTEIISICFMHKFEDLVTDIFLHLLDYLLQIHLKL